VAALGEGLRTQQEATHTAIAALTSGQGQLTGDVRELQELTRTVAGNASDAVREQAALRDVLEDSTKAVTSVTEAVHRGQDTLQTRLESVAEGGKQTMATVTTVLEIQENIQRMMEEVAGIGNSQVPFGEALRAHGDVIHMAVAALAASEERLTHDVRQLHEFTRALAGGITDAAREQAEAHGALQQALNGTTEIVQQGHNTVQTKLEDLAGTGRQMMEAMSAIAAEQKTAQETTQRTVEEVLGRQGTLAENLQSQRQAADSGIATLSESLQTQRQALDHGVGVLSEGQGRLAGDLRQLHELTQTVSGGVSEVARDQAAAHAAMQQALSGTTEAVQQGHQALHIRLDELAGTERQTIEAVTTIAAGQTALHETARHVLEGVNGVAGRQTAFGEALQAHRDTMDAQAAALLGGQGQLAGDLRQLHDLTQTLAGGVGESAREQAAAHGALQQTLNGTTELMQQGQQVFQTKLDDLAGTGRETNAALAAMAAGQAALGEALQAHGDATNAGVSALRSGQGQLAGDLRQLHDLTQTVAGGVTDVAREQAAAHGALQDRARDLTAATDAIQHSQRALKIELEKLAESTTQTIEAVHAVAVGQTSGREATRHMVSELANAAMTALGGGQTPWTRLDRPLEALVKTMTGGGPLNIELPPPAEEVPFSPRLSAAHAIIHGEQMKYEIGPDRDNLGYWADPRDWAEWELEVPQPGRFKVTAEVATLGASRFQVLLGDQGLEANAPSTGDYGRFQKVEIGTVELPAVGKTSVAVRPIAEGWQPMNLRSVELVPLPSEN
jgi:uncharacterized phage infection (PIP) family protein YhgE